MRKFYQRQWHKINFEDFAVADSGKPAGAEFYKEFYKRFFLKYPSFSCLDAEWVRFKTGLFKFLRGLAGEDKGKRILSVGCGIGVIEKLLVEAGYFNLEVTEVSDEALAWVYGFLPGERVHVGDFPGCLPLNRSYDLIYLASVEYCFTCKQLCGLLGDARALLSDGGMCVLISHSVERTGALNAFRYACAGFKDWFMEAMRIRHRGQLWGYMRKPEELISVMRSAGFSHVHGGFMETNSRWPAYWLTGLNMQR